MTLPVHIVTGFLGSGKTTLIKKLLTETQHDSTVVLINELGAVGIDHLLVQTVADNTYLLANGCMCCTVLSDLKESLLTLLQQRKRGEIPDFKRVMIETTGLANPAAILNTIHHDTHIKGQFYVHGLSTVVDAELGHLQAELHPEWLTQVVAAHQIILSKTDRTEHSTLQVLTQKLQQIHPEVAILAQDQIRSMDDLFALDLTDQQHLSRPQFFLQTQQTEHAMTQSCVLQWSEKVDWMVLGLWLNLLLNQYGENILRLKGILNLTEYEQPVLIHGVQHCLYPPEHLTQWPWEDRHSRIVMIVRHVDLAKIQKSFQLFMEKLT